ncbi:DUF294 nucleotidyltransferase-like domain-containing protein [Fulvivirga lutea]|uniref:Cyclic nucleotide-binding domain-containing protein n=1 Tax=Fulvivirga lutea TaxID=2810512 RepID=A0A975A1Q5_9BACT|nr:DUF294 nucleotidyltransferase-like domain-containing protein [Fulvivirga lutea]QSE98470.1 cyclic nucleotide-binding domain-containing protein [Fulvivirga lutea]
MAANVIASRIADFLKKFPPFEEISDTELLMLCEKAIVKYANKGEYLFKQGESSSPYLYVVKEGLVHLERQTSTGAKELVDICDEGDLFGVRSMLSGKPYVFDARCEEEALVYGIPIEEFKKHLESNSKIALFFASGLAGGQSDVQQGPTQKMVPVQESGSLLNWNKPLAEPKRALITCKSTDLIKDVAGLMTMEQIGSIIICNDEQKAIGIATETDFKTKVATGKVAVTQPISEIMTPDVITMNLGKPLSSYLLKMLQHKINHLCLVKKGLPVGILSHHDLTGASQNHPITLGYTMEQAAELSELVELRNQADALINFYLEQHVSIQLVSSLASHINDITISKCIECALQEVGEPTAKFAWISLGSEGRQEQLIRTDQDNALIYEDNQDESTRLYFIKLAQKINSNLEACGFEMCPAEMMGGNEKWCQPLNQWKKYFSGWIHQPQEKSLMLSTIFFDYRHVYGAKELADELGKHLKNEIKSGNIFIHFLAKNSLQNPPPLSFFKNFVVERSGEHVDRFDIKARAMMPLVDIARVLALNSGESISSNTLVRYKWLEKNDKNNAELYKLAAESYEYLMRFRALNGFQNKNSGRYISIESLSKIERQILRNTFEPINRLQKMLEVRFQLSYFN